MNGSIRRKIRSNPGFLVYVFASVFVLGVAVYMVSLTAYVFSYLADTLRARLVAAARAAVDWTDIEELERFQTAADMDTPEYAAFKDRLLHFGEKFEIMFVYYYRVLPGGRLQAIVDNDFTEESYSLETAPLECEPPVQRAIDERVPAVTGLEIYSPGWDGFLSAFAPIMSGAGDEVRYIAGVDVSDEYLLKVRRRTALLAALLIAVLLVLLVSGFVIFVHYRNREKSLSLRLKQQRLMSRLARSFISARDTETLINEALRITGEFLDASRLVIGIASGDSAMSTAAYVWTVSPDIVTAPVKEGLNGIINSFPPQEPPEGSVPVIYSGDVLKDPRYRVMSTVGVAAFIMMPLYVDGKFWAVLAVEEHRRPREWTESDRQLVSTVSSVITGAAIRDMREKERDAALVQAERASRAKSDFLANMSHEMRTPMNAIIGMTAIARSSHELEKKEYCLDKIEEASTHLLGVINDILDMSKIEANKFELSHEDFNFEKMLRKMVNVINYRVEEKKQGFSVRIDRRIPRYLHGDDQRLSQVISNLLSNAVKFTPEKGSITLDARLEEERESCVVLRISVADTGIGISPEQKARLFSSFEQADSSTSRKFGGTGLGLAISKRIVEMMDGIIQADSEEGKGSVFTFTACIARAENRAAESLLAPGINWRNIRMLAIDDMPEIRDWFRELAVELGCNIDTAGDGNEALSLIRGKGAYDIYFVDWKMPGMNGIELSRAIKGIPQGADPSGGGEHTASRSVVIMISAAEWNAVETEARAAGVDKFLSKPLFPSAIADIVNECLGVDAAPAPAPGAEQERFDGRWILLAEDVEINREIVLSLLEPTGVNIDCAENGAEAVRFFQENPGKYSMIFMDVQMPEMDGYGATRQIREIEAASGGRKVPIIAMTANVFKEDVDKCLEAGMNGHVGKPLDFDDVMAKMREYLVPA